MSWPFGPTGSVSRSSRIAAPFVATLALLGLLVWSPESQARDPHFDHHDRGPSFVFGLGLYDPEPYYYAPPPVYYAPPPTYYAPPPPVYYASPPSPVTYGQPVSAPFVGPNGLTCQRYQTSTNGQTPPTVSTACLQPDGTWRVAY